MTQRVHCEIHDGVARLIFDNQRAYNALTNAMWHELADHCTALAKNRDVRVVTLEGAGDKAFVSGNDISGFLTFEGGEDGIAYEREISACVETVEDLPQPSIALINGWAVGGGIALSFSCDFRIATPGSRFGSPIARTVGNCLSARNYARIFHHLGPSLAKRVLLLGEIVSAERLESLGLIHAIVAREELHKAGADLCAELKQNAPLTISASKEAMRRIAYSALPDIDDLIRTVYSSEDFKRGVRGFVNKQRPEWTGA